MTELAKRLTSRVIIQKAVQTKDQSSGGYTRTYEDIRPLWAEVKDLGHREMRFGKQDGTATTRITIRFTEDITPRLFIQERMENHPHRRFKINQIMIGGKYEYLECLCTEIEESPF